MEIRRGRPEDYEELMQRVLLSFCEHSPSHIPFQDLRPSEVGADEERMSQWLIAEENGEIAAGLQIIPRPLQITPEVKLDASGVGNVFTCPEFRGRGLMKTLLQQSIEIFSKEDHPINMLGGDRLRYGNYGWEHAGCERQLRLGRNMVRFTERKARATDFRRWDGDEEDVRRMFDAYNELPCRSCRTFDEHHLVLQRPGVCVWISEEGDEFAYIAVNGKEIVEYAGAVRPFEKLLRFLIGSTDFTVAVPSVDAESEVDRIMLSYAAGYKIQATKMIRINNLKGVLEAYQPVLEERLQQWEGRRVLQIDDTGEAVVIARTSSGVAIENVSSEQAQEERCLELSRRESARLLFGPFPPSCKDIREDIFWRGAFPLPFYWGVLGYV